jgi:hypothetical protein
MFKVVLEDPSEVEELLGAGDYKDLLEESKES